MDFRPYVRDRLPPLAIAREPEIVDEIAQHLADLYREGRAAGLTHDEAFARAAAAMPERPRDLARDIERASRALPGLIADRWYTAAADTPPSGRFVMLADLRRDVVYGARMLARTPAFTAVVLLTLALGIGATAVIFTAVDAVLLRTPGVADPGSIVRLYTGSPEDRQVLSSTSYPDYADLQASGLVDAAAFSSISLALDAGGETVALTGEIVTGNYFDVLGVAIAPGRGFRADEDVAGRPVRVVVISQPLWQERFGADAAIVGRSLSLNGNAYTILGVAPPAFGGVTIGRPPQVWAPMALQPELRPPSAGVRRQLGTSLMLDLRGPGWLNMVGRLKPASDIARLQTDLGVLSRRLQSAYPNTNRRRQFTALPLSDAPGVRSAARPLLQLLFVAVVCVLLIACANVASLLLARAVSRRREVAVRMAVGAGRSRLVRQWLTESLILALLGAAGGVLIAYWGAPLLHVAGIPESVRLGVNVRVLGFTLLTALASGLIFGLAPVLQTIRQDTVASLRDEGGAVASGANAARLRKAFVVFQVAASLMLLIGAGLFLRTLRNAHQVDLGYRVDRIMVADVNLDVRGYAPEAGQRIYAAIVERLQGMPGVAAAGAARVTVMSGNSRTTTLSLDGRPPTREAGNGINVRVNVVTPGYLEALGIPLLAGRGFTAADTPSSPRVAVVSRSLANRLWPGADPIGRTLTDGGDNGATVVGLIPDAVYRNVLERDAPPFFYVPLSQSYESGVTLHVRAEAGDPLALLPVVREVVREADPRLVVTGPLRLREIFNRSIADERMMAILVGLFGAIALILAAVGVYGVMTQIASERTAEIGIRLALGARPSAILGLVAADGIRLLAIGTVLGLAAAIAGRRYVASQLFGVTPGDPLTLAAACVVLAAIGLAACLLPARRAMRIDPIRALRVLR